VSRLLLWVVLQRLIAREDKGAGAGNGIVLKLIL
jgi:hypothetical protein